MPKHKRASLELSVNFLVTLILAVVMFSLGLAIFYNIVIKGNTIFENVYDKLNKEIADEFINNPSLQVAVVRYDSKIERGKKIYFGFGISNYVGYQGNYSIEVYPYLVSNGANVLCQEKNDCNNKYNCTKWVIPNKWSFPIDKNSRVTRLFIIKIPKNAPKATYLFDLIVSTSSGTISKQQIEFVVP